MKTKTKINPKALKYAKDYLYSACLYGLWDCSDSMYDAEKLEQRFLAVVDDKISIKDFIRENLRNEFIEAFKLAWKEGGYLLKDEEGEDGNITFVSELPFTYTEFRADLYKDKEFIKKWN